MTLDQLRRSIDRLDQKIIGLLNQRAGVALLVGRLKQQQGLPILARGREQAVYDKLAAINTGPLDDEQLNRIYLRIMREMKHLQRRQTANGKTAGRKDKTRKKAVRR